MSEIVFLIGSLFIVIGWCYLLFFTEMGFTMSTFIMVGTIILFGMVMVPLLEGDRRHEREEEAQRQEAIELWVRSEMGKSESVAELEGKRLALLKSPVPEVSAGIEKREEWYERVLKTHCYVTNARDARLVSITLTWYYNVSGPGYDTQITSSRPHYYSFNPPLERGADRFVCFNPSKPEIKGFSVLRMYGPCIVEAKYEDRLVEKERGFNKLQLEKLDDDKKVIQERLRQEAKTKFEDPK